MSVRRSIILTYLAQAAAFFITFASTLIIARLVSPRDFGIYAMVNAVTTVISVFMGFQLSKYITRESELTKEILHSTFTVNVLASASYVICILAGGFVAATFFDASEVSQVMVVFAIFPVFAAFEFMPAALCAREMRFGTIAWMAVVRAAVMAVVGVVLARQGYAYMTFAWAQVAAWAATSIAFNILYWRPEAYGIRFRGIGSILSFGGHMMGISGVNALNVRLSEMSLGSLAGLAALGFYTRASSLPTQLYQNIYGASSNVIFSRLSHDLRQGGEIHSSYLRFMQLILGFLWPLMFGLAILAQPVIHILYGEKWQASAGPLSLLTCAAAVLVAVGMSNEVFILRRETQRQLKIEITRCVLGIGLFVAGAMISLTMAAAAKVGEAIIAFLLYYKSMDRLVGAPGGALPRMYVESAIVTLPAVVPAFALMLYTDWSPETPLPLAAGAVLLGIAGWAVTLHWRRHPIAMEVRHFVTARLVRRPA